MLVHVKVVSTQEICTGYKCYYLSYLVSNINNTKHFQLNTCDIKQRWHF